MLYDKRWDSKKNASEDISREFSLRGLIAWLETQNPQTVYCYDDRGRCLAAQFNQRAGREYRVSPCIFCIDEPEIRRVPFQQQLERIAVEGDHTFGAALSRARKIAESA